MKWISKIVYVVFVGVVVFFVVSMSLTSRISTYHDDKRAEYSESEYLGDYILSFYASMVDSNLNQSYHSLTPLYEFKGELVNSAVENDDHIEYSIDLSIVNLTIFNPKDTSSTLDLLGVVISNVRYNKNKSPETPQISNEGFEITYEFAEGVKNPYNPDKIETFANEKFTGTIDGYYVSFFKTMDLRKNVNTDEKLDSYVDISRIEIAFSNNADETVKLLSLTNKNVTDSLGNQLAPRQDCFLADDVKRQYEVTKDDSNLSWSISPEQAMNDNNTNYFYMEITFSGYNWVIVRNILIMVGVILIFTYLIFFHKKVMEIITKKKAEKKILNASAEPIFKEADETKNTKK